MRADVCGRCQADQGEHVWNLPLYLSGEEILHLCGKCLANEPGIPQRVFKVPSYNLSRLDDKFAKLGRRAKKCGLPPPTYNVFKEEPVRLERKNEVTGEKEVKAYILHYITVDPGCNVVKVEGWTFVATIQHTEEGNIIRQVGEKEIPTKYRQVTQLCEHCNTNRNRKDTYILHNESTNDYKQVGRNCLADFFGHDALMYAERAQYLVDIADMTDAEGDSEGGWGGGRGELHDPLDLYLEIVAEVIQKNGWMSGTRARAMDRPYASTANIALEYLRPPRDRDAYNKWLRTRPFDPPVSEESKKLAHDAMEWAANLEGEEISEYLHNIRVVARREVCGGREYGLAASIVAAYQKHIGALRMQELAKKRAEVSKYVGQVGERKVFRLFVEKVMNFERDGYSYYQPSVTVHMHVMSDAEGNQFTWWGSHALETGKEVVLKGTVKKHEEYISKKAPPGTPGIKQTILSRCEEVEYKKYSVFVDGRRYEFEALCEKDVRPLLREKLNVGKLPRGLEIVEEKPEVNVVPLENINDLAVSL